jgi:hypothetical protein
MVMAHDGPSRYFCDQELPYISKVLAVMQNPVEV